MSNFAKRFIETDSLCNVKNEIIFSLLQRYNCFAGCKVCYTQNDFKKALPEFKKFVPTVIDKNLEKQWYQIFDHFYCISSIDDIFWMKHNQPHLYKWYIDNDHYFSWGNMTDNNFIRSQPLFINEFSQQTSIYEITFSAKWLHQIDIDDVETKLNTLFDRNGINKIKFIFDDANDYEIDNFKRILDWTYDKGIHKFNSSHHNFLGEMKVLDKGDVDVYECASQDGELFNPLNQSDYLQYDNFFITLQQAIDTGSKPYYKFTDFNPEDHMYNMLKSKLEQYKDWATRYRENSIVVPEQSRKLFEYFDWVSKCVKINKDFNFIPGNLLQSNSRYYTKLQEKNYQATQYGLIKNMSNVIPLLEIIDG